MAKASKPKPTVPWVKPELNLEIIACAQASEYPLVFPLPLLNVGAEELRLSRLK